VTRTSHWDDEFVNTTRNALQPLSNPELCAGMAAYMKGVAPFLGISAPKRQAALRASWKQLPPPTSEELGRAATRLFALPEREFHYAACDAISKYREVSNEYFLDEYLSQLLITKPWWDTVDSLVSAAVSPLCRKYDADWLITKWSQSSDTWLIRAAITHQRGWKFDTKVDRVLEICDQHWAEQEFFIAKAIGWALRDIAKFDSLSVEGFLASHPYKNTIARREAMRGINAQTLTKEPSSYSRYQR
jgi:3-methyladenine DNA glycosylase AlkD